MNGPLKKEEYVEENCILVERPDIPKGMDRIPQQRISQKLDELMGDKDTAGAERLLKYWRNEAKAIGDRQGEFMVYNEMMGYYRKVKRQKEAYEATDTAMSMLKELGYTDTISGATCYTNAATVYTDFGEYRRAMPLFEKARVIYETGNLKNEYKTAGLYNNMAIASTALGNYREANVLYQKALDMLRSVKDSELEQAVTYLNMLDTLLAEGDFNDTAREKAAEYLYLAEICLDADNLERDDYYAFVAEKCYPIYETFGWDKYANKLKERIREIHERS